MNRPALLLFAALFTLTAGCGESGNSGSTSAASETRITGEVLDD